MLLKNIKALCKERGKTLAELERSVGLGNGVIARWDAMSPRVENVKRVADFLGVGIDDLLCDADKDA